MNIDIQPLRKFHAASPSVRAWGGSGGSLQSRLIRLEPPHAGFRIRTSPGTSAAERKQAKIDADDALPLGEHPFARSRRMARVEAVLLLAREPVPSRRLSQLAGLTDGTEARTLTRKLNRFYDESQRAYRIEEIAGGFQLLTRGKFAPWLRRLSGSSNEVRLSAPAMESLSVVAYRQPVMRAEVESIRGVQCGEILRQLMERGLVRIVGRADELGRPFLYGTSKKFLQVFGLRHLDELPRADMLRKVEDTASESSENGSANETAEQREDQAQESSEMKIVRPDQTDELTSFSDDPEGPGVAVADLPPTKSIFEEEVEDEDDDDEENFAFDDDDEDEDIDDEEGDEWEEVDDEEEDDEEFDDEDDDEEWDDEEDEDEWADDDWEDDDEDEEDDDEL